MSTESRMKFLAEIKNNPALKEKFNLAITNCQKQFEDNLSRSIIEIAKKAGFELEITDVMSLISCDECDDEMLKNISGGFGRLPPLPHPKDYVLR